MRYVGTYRGRAPAGAGAPEIVGRVWEEGDRLHYRLGAMGDRTGMRHHLVPVGDDRFVLGRYQGGRVAVDPHTSIRFIVEGSHAEALEADMMGQVHLTVRRADPNQLRADTDQLLAEREARGGDGRPGASPGPPRHPARFSPLRRTPARHTPSRHPRLSAAKRGPYRGGYRRVRDERGGAP